MVKIARDTRHIADVNEVYVETLHPLGVSDTIPSAE